MNSNQILLTSLLSSALGNQSIENVDLANADLMSLYEEALAHQVHTLIYPLIKEYEFKNPSNKAFMSKWKKQMLISGVAQLKHIEQMEILLNEFNKANIKFIPLKGLVLRELYPIPEMRTMGDADILVEPKDIGKASRILSNMGYKKQSTDSKHIHFIHNTHMCIEIHFFIVSKDSLSKNLDEFETHVWQNAKKSNVCNTPSLILSLEDQMLHLILHMAVHLSSGGFGLRQLCDLFVFTEKNYNNIDWDNIYKKTSDYGLTTFASTLFNICKKLFNEKIPEIFIKQHIEWNYMNALIEDIFSGGIFGSRTTVRELGGIQLRYTNHIDSSNAVTPLRKIISLLFPPIELLGIQYSYAKKFPILTPAAWLHRIFYGLFRNDFTLSEKKSFLFPSKSASLEIINRAKLLHQLDLK